MIALASCTPGGDDQKEQAFTGYELNIPDAHRLLIWNSMGYLLEQ
jgi:hypothetical protein